MSYEDKILNFLTQSENLPIAFQITEYVQKLKETNHQQFWPMLSIAMIEKLKSSEHGENWIYVPLTQEKWNEEYVGCGIQPIDGLSTDQPVIQIAFMQATPKNDLRLFMGVVCLPKIPKDLNRENLNTLVEELIRLGMKSPNYRWFGYHYLHYHLREESFIIKLHKEPQVLMDESSAIYWDFFLKIHPYVQAVHESLSR